MNGAQVERWTICTILFPLFWQRGGVRYNRDPQISIFTIVFLVKIFVVFKISCRPSPATSLIQQTFSPSVFLVRGKFSLRQSISAMADKENPPKELPQEPPVLPHQRFAGPGKYIL